MCRAGKGCVKSRGIDLRFTRWGRAPTYISSMNILLRHGSTEQTGSVTLEGFCRTAARAVAGGKAWTFRRSGLLHPTVSVRRDGESTAPLVAGIGATGRCDLTLDGRQYRWKATSCLRGQFAWLAADGTELIRYRPRMPWRRGAQEIDVLAADLPAETAALLALLGAFLLMLTVNDAAAVTAAIVAAAIVS